MKKDNFLPNLSLEEREKRLLEMSDDEIDYSDIPSLDNDFLSNNISKLLELAGIVQDAPRNASENAEDYLE